MHSFFKDIIDTYTNSNELKEFAVSWSLDEEPYVKKKECFSCNVNNLFERIEKNVSIPTPESHGCEQLLDDVSVYENLVAAIPSLTEVTGPSKP